MPPLNHTGGKWKPTSSKTRTSNSPTLVQTKSSSPTPPKESYEVPPPTFTGSKWAASKAIRNDYEDAPPPNHTKGKWKPQMPQTPLKNWSSDDQRKDKNEEAPSPSYTKGKWKPSSSKETDNKIYKLLDSEAPPFRKSSGTVQYWCGPCNRTLASKIVYERHLKSDLHYRRTLQDREFDDSSNLNTSQLERKKNVTKRRVVEYWSGTGEERRGDNMAIVKRARRKIYAKCEVCRSRVNNKLMGKHLISHYHCRRGDVRLPEARKMVLDNIYSIVLQSPFQCSLCKFYCNTHEYFLDHWVSEAHKDNDCRFMGYFWCTYCKYKCMGTREMHGHLLSNEHKEVISAFNGSVPIVIKKLKPIECSECHQQFTLNVQLRKHCEKERHPYSATATDMYQGKQICTKCSAVFKSRTSLQRHLRIIHKENVYFCSFCSSTFLNISDVKKHRRSSQHRKAVSEKNECDTSKLCQYCNSVLNNVEEFRNHLKEKHPDKGSKCPQCDETFAIPQDLTLHVRRNACSYKRENKKNICEKCQFSTDSISQLLFHEALHGEPVFVDKEDSSSKRPHYKCPVCEKVFEKSSLKFHVGLHSKERPYVCDICKAGFIRKNNWIYHVKKHKRSSSSGCLKKKTSGGGEVGERPFLCSFCGDSFKKK